MPAVRLPDRKGQPAVIIVSTIAAARDSGADGYAAQNQTGMWGYLLGDGLPLHRKRGSLTLSAAEPALTCGIAVVADLLHPVYVLAADHVRDSDVAHRISRRGAMPVLHAQRCPDNITGLDLPLLTAFFLKPARPGCDDQDLACGMSVPGGPRARRENYVPARR